MGYIKLSVIGIVYYFVFPGADGDMVPAPGDDIFRRNGGFTQSTGGIDDILGYGHARGIAPEFFHNFNAIIDRGLKMRGADDLFSMKNIVGLDSGLKKLLIQAFHNMGIIVDSPEQNGLVPQWDSGPGQKFTGGKDLFGQFLGVVDLGVEINRMILCQHVA